MPPLTFRPLAEADLLAVAGWLSTTHVQRWWRDPSDLDRVREKYLPRIHRDEPTEVFVIVNDRHDVGIIQRYRLGDYPDWQTTIAGTGLSVANSAGIDYLIGDPGHVSRGVGTRAIQDFTALIFDDWPEVERIVVTPQVDNHASCRVLQKAGYELRWTGFLDSDDPSDAGIAALYELSRRSIAEVQPPSSDVEGCARAQGRLFEVVSDLSDEDVGRASRLPGWSVGHVLTHLARNAEAMCRRIDGATRGQMVEQYVGGSAGRAAEIERGAARSVREIKDDLAEWSNKLIERFQTLPTELWGRPVRTVSGGEHPISEFPFRRWREVEVHLVDLGLAVTPDDWSQELVDRALPRLLSGLADRADERKLMAWLLGRGPAPDLDPWG